MKHKENLIYCVKYIYACINVTSSRVISPQATSVQTVVKNTVLKIRTEFPGYSCQALGVRLAPVPFPKPFSWCH